MTVLGAVGRELLDVWNRWGGPRVLEAPAEAAEARARHYILAGIVSDAFAYGPSILEVGCGVGATYAMLKRLRPRYRGVDRSDGAIARCRERFAADTGASFEVDSIDRVESAEPFDVVILNGVLDVLPRASIRPALERAQGMLLGSKSLLVVVSARTPRAGLVWASSTFLPDPMHRISIRSRGGRDPGWTLRVYTHLAGDRGQGAARPASAPS